MRSAIIGVCVLLGICATAGAAVSVGVSPREHPDLVPVPGSPASYALQLDSNLFFYNGLYWVYAEDGWYSSSWCNGPWDMVAPALVPISVLRVPLPYYRQPPPYFRAGSPEALSVWGEHSGRHWEQRWSAWDHSDRASAPARAALPQYQRASPGDPYPRDDLQPALRNQNYKYEPRDASAHQQHNQLPPPAAAQGHMPPDRASRGDLKTDSIDPRYALTAAAAVAVTARRDSASPTGERAEATLRPVMERAASPQDGTSGAEHRDGLPELGLR
jgi:hypothetical protein